jgi:hypothetical protein
VLAASLTAERYSSTFGGRRIAFKIGELNQALQLRRTACGNAPAPVVELQPTGAVPAWMNSKNFSRWQEHGIVQLPAQDGIAQLTAPNHFVPVPDIQVKVRRELLFRVAA